MSSVSTIAPWQEEVQRHFPRMSMAQARVLAQVSSAMMMTMHSGTTYLSHWLAKHEGGSANTARQRIREWYDEARAKRGHKRREIVVEEHFADLLAWVLEGWEGEKRLVLVLDATTLTERFTSLSIGLVLAGCLIPVAWHLLPAHEKGEWQPHWLRLIGLLRGVIPADWQVVVMTDRGLYAGWLYQAIVDNRWHPMMRVNEAMGFRAQGEETFRPIGERVKRRGRRWKGEGAWSEQGERLTGTLMVGWETGYEERLAVVTDATGADADLAFYQMRFWTEDGFKDQKRGGWRWEHTKMSDPQRASRLWFALALTMLWAIRVGSAEEGSELVQQSRHTRKQPGKRGRPRKQFHRPRAREQSVIVRGQQTISVAASLGRALPLGHVIAQPWPRHRYAVGKPAACWEKTRKRREQRRRERHRTRSWKQRHHQRVLREQEREAKRQAKREMRLEREQEQEAKRQARQERKREQEAKAQAKQARQQQAQASQGEARRPGQPVIDSPPTPLADRPAPLLHLCGKRLVAPIRATTCACAPIPRRPAPPKCSLLRLCQGRLVPVGPLFVQEIPP